MEDGGTPLTRTSVNSKPFFVSLRSQAAGSTVFPNCNTGRLTRFNIEIRMVPPSHSSHIRNVPRTISIMCDTLTNWFLAVVLKFIYCFFSVASPFLSDYSINTEKLKQINIISFNIIVNEHHSKLGESLEVSAVFGKQQFCLCYNFDTIWHV